MKKTLYVQCIHCPRDLSVKTGQHGSWLTSAINLAWCLGSWKTTSKEMATFTSNSSHAGLVWFNLCTERYKPWCLMAEQQLKYCQKKKLTKVFHLVNYSTFLRAIALSFKISSLSWYSIGESLSKRTKSDQQQ